MSKLRRAWDLAKWPVVAAIWLFVTWYVKPPPKWTSMEASQMKEDDLERAVRDLLALYGLDEFSYHTHDSRRSQPGFPDWVIAGKNGVLYRELKSESGRVSRAQNRWIARLRESGQDVDVWRPADLKSGRITRELLGLREAR